MSLYIENVSDHAAQISSTQSAWERRFPEKSVRFQSPNAKTQPKLRDF